jgi:UDP-N-acetyl-D-galactosamine dehydrogenase
VFIVTVPTPIRPPQAPRLTALVKASETVGRALKPGAVVVYESTVYHRLHGEDCVPNLEKFAA